VSSRQRGVEQAPDVRIGVRIPASQPFILWQLLEFPKISTTVWRLPTPFDFVML